MTEKQKKINHELYELKEKIAELIQLNGDLVIKLEKSKEILKRFVKWFDYISESENWKTIVADARKLLEDK